MLQGVAGTFHSLFSGCPLPILRPTGPITAFMIDLYSLSSWVGVGYYALVSWYVSLGSWSVSALLCSSFDLMLEKLPSSQLAGYFVGLDFGLDYS